MTTRAISNRIKKRVLEKSGGRCAFPGCHEQLIRDGILVGQFEHIYPASPGAARWWKDVTGADLNAEENLILVCATHNLIIDRDPVTYNADFLTQAKRSREADVETAAETPALGLDPTKAVPFVAGVALWHEHADNAQEEFWHQVFRANPWLLSIAFPDHMLLMHDKCYVGGKDITNSGGNIVDFVFTAQHGRNVALVEIKTPDAALVGSRYRTNAYSMSEELSGAVIQVLTYRDSLLKHFYELNKGLTVPTFAALNPRCFVIAGRVDRLGADQRQSLELFRSTLANVWVLGFDELFAKVADVCQVAGLAT